jgi:predicted permease
MGILGQNVKFAVRQLRRSPGFSLTVIVTLALAIGANTAIFSVVNALMLKSLPYRQPERMGTIYTRIQGQELSNERHHVNGEQFELLRDDVPALITAISATGTSGVNLQAGSRVQYVHAARVSARYFDVLAIQPVFGRNFTETEDLPNGPKAAILGYGLWRNIFGSNREIVGESFLLKGEPYTVIGVLPEGAVTPLNADLYTALQASQRGEGGGTNFDLITRLRDGATWEQADAQINRVWSHRNVMYELGDDPGARVSYHSVPLQKGATDWLRPQILGLMTAAGFILLIACGNLAALTLVRVMRRSSEVATRLALGASRWQIQKQLWIENLLLACIGGTAAMALGFMALRGMLSLLPERFLPTARVSLDARVLIFTLAISVLTSVFCGMLPAFTTRRFDVRASIGNRAVTSADRLRLRQVLIAGEIALTVVLVAGSGLLVRTLIHLETLPPGFNPSGVMTAKASLDDARYHDAAAFRKLLKESTEAMSHIPGVQYAAAGLALPYERTLNDNLTLSDGPEAGDQIQADLTYVTPDYFRALQIPLVEGRAFTASDGPDTQHVAVVNQIFAKKFFHGGSPVGHYVDKNTLIVGLVGDVAIAPGLRVQAPLSGEEAMYIPATQVDAHSLVLLHMWFQPSWIVRTAGPIDGLSAQMQRALASVDPNLPFSGFYSMRDLLARTLAMQRVEVALLSTMGGLALLLSAVGIFALVANIVAQRRREVGIRIALGSTVRQAMVEVGAPGIRAAGLGMISGIVLCLGTLRMMRTVLYGVGVYDVPTIIAVLSILACVTVVATTVPTLRVARIDPAETLREQ